MVGNYAVHIHAWSYCSKFGHLENLKTFVQKNILIDQFNFEIVLRVVS